MIAKKGLAGAILAAVTLPGSSRSTQTRSSPLQADTAIAAKVAAYMGPLVRMGDFGGNVLITRRGTVLAFGSYQPVGAPSGPAITRATRFGVGSVTKTFTAAAIILLAQQGRLSLRDTLSRFFPGLPHSDSITVEQLLRHTAGLRDYYSWLEFARRRQQTVSLGELVNLAGREPLDFAPGTRSGYSNTGYAVLAALVERVAGVRYSRFLRDNLLAPLHLNNTGDLSDGSSTAGLAPGYDPDLPPRLLRPAEASGRSWLEGSGSLYSTVDDLAHWAEAVRLDSLIKWSRLEPFGWGPRTSRGRSFLEQNGRTALGYVTYLAIYPAEDLVIVVASNVQADMTERTGHDLAAIALGEPYQVPNVRSRPVSLSPMQCAAYAGRYEIAPGFVLTVRNDSVGLSLAGPDGAFLPLDAQDDGHFFFRPLYKTVTFERAASGSVTSLDWGGQFRARRLE